MNLTVRRWLARSALLGLPALLGGCAVAMVGGAVVASAVSVTSAVVVTGVELTGKAVGAGIDAMAPPSTPKPAPLVAVAAVPVKPAASTVASASYAKPEVAPAPAAETNAVSSSQPVAPTPLEPRPAQ